MIQGIEPVRAKLQLKALQVDGSRQHRIQIILSRLPHPG